jgi:hypothetical protein
MKYLDYVTYWKNIAINLKEISHTDDVKRFCRMNIEEVFNGLRTELSIISAPCLILESYQMNVEDRLSDNLRDKKTGAIWVVKHVPEDTFDAEDTVLGETEICILKIISKLKKDKSTNQLIKHIDLSSINVNKTAKLWDNCIGWRMEFTIDDSLNFNVKYEPNDWHS